MSEEVREFDLGDILSITTGVLLSPRLIEGVYDILNFMTRDNLFTHQLPRASEECKSHILNQHPKLSKVEVPDWGPDVEPLYVRAWLATMKLEYGGTLPIKRLAPEDHTPIHPIDELVMMGVDKEKIIAVVIDPDE